MSIRLSARSSASVVGVGIRIAMLVVATVVSTVLVHVAVVVAGTGAALVGSTYVRATVAIAATV